MVWLLGYDRLRAGAVMSLPPGAREHDSPVPLPPT